jgi:hypothetical protein
MSLIYTCELNDANATAAAEVAQALTHQIGEIFPSEELRYRWLPPTQSRQVIPEIISRMLFRFIVIEDYDMKRILAQEVLGPIAGRRSLFALRR